MAQVKCEYCGSYIEDCEEFCSQCGAVNDNYVRSASGTPKTIEELKSWYIARKLPPEETTRFFIGKNIKEPKAFGIYKDGRNFVVYKNKANGQRAVRYKGTDEAYAVNELYMRLKEEILNQKSNNLAKRERNVSGSTYDRSNYGKVSYTYNEPYDNRGRRTSRSSYGSKRKKKGFLASLTAVMLAPILSCLIIAGSFLGVMLLIGEMDTTSAYYYVSDAKDVYYLQDYKEDDNYVWWNYNKDTKEWSQYDIYHDKDEFPPNITKDNQYYSEHEVATLIGQEYKDVDIYRSRAFIDAGNHRTPNTAYYCYNDKYYYFLDDEHSSYGNTDNTGWYVYENNAWQYYCDEDDKEALGDDLWYSESDYSKGSFYNSGSDLAGISWESNVTNFADTSWYKSYESNEDAYERHLEESNSSSDSDWDDDSDYDWDSGSDWDSSSTDWDSDW